MKKKNTILQDLKGFIPVAHRGAPYEYPENTLPSLKRALSFHQDIMLEIDVWETKDNKVVILHDEDFNRIANCAKKAKELTLAEIKELDIGNNITFDEGLTYPYRKKGYSITTLDDVLNAFPDTTISIDIKYNQNIFAKRVAETILECNAAERVIVGSFNSKIVAFIRNNFPEITTIFSRSEVYKLMFFFKLGLIKFFKPKDRILCLPEFSSENNPEQQGKCGFQGIRIVTKKLVAAVHKLGIPIFVWTINKKENMVRLISWGVDGIVTDYPDRLVEAMREMGITSKPDRPSVRQKNQEMIHVTAAKSEKKPIKKKTSSSSVTKVKSNTKSKAKAKSKSTKTKKKK